MLATGTLSHTSKNTIVNYIDKLEQDSITLKAIELAQKKGVDYYLNIHDKWVVWDNELEEVSITEWHRQQKEE